jgi:hypothetical protein
LQTNWTLRERPCDERIADGRRTYDRNRLALVRAGERELGERREADQADGERDQPCR